MIPLVPRVRLLVAEHGSRIALAFALVGALALGGAAWTYTHPPTEEVTERVHVQTIRTGVDTRAYITNENSFWEQGIWLENGTIYPLDAAPELTLRVRTDVPAGTDVAVNHGLAVVYRADREGHTFWRESEPVSTMSEVTNDGSVVSSTDVDVRSVRSRLSTLNGDLAGLGRASASLRLSVSYTTDRYEGTLTRKTPIRFAGNGYWLADSLAAEKRHGTTVVRDVPGEPDESTVLALVLLGFAGLAGAVVVTVVDRRGIDPPTARQGLERTRYAEWVSNGRLRQAISGQDVPMETLRDLVDLAMDAKLRVIHDPERDLYAVISDGVIYHYDPAGPDAEAESSAIDPPKDVGLAVTGDGGSEPETYIGDFDDVPETSEGGGGEEDDERCTGDEDDHDPWGQLI